LTFEEIAAVCDAFVSLGIDKIRLTGGEPMVRKDIERLVAKLVQLKDKNRTNRLRELAMITNGTNFAKKATLLRLSGLDRVTFSLDSLRAATFRSITGVDKLEEVLRAIDAAKAAEFERIKVNAVIVRGRNDKEIVDLARFARKYGISMRFIEFMPLDAGHIWDRSKVVPSAEVHETISRVFPLILTDPSRRTGTAWTYRFVDGAKGDIGLISPVTDPFCGACSRVRLTADGKVRTCLFSSKEHDLRSLLRSGASRDVLVRAIRSIVLKKEPGHTINTGRFRYASRPMSAIGG
jgi:cyclic pyranopterin phosphate synthase